MSIKLKKYYTFLGFFLLGLICFLGIVYAQTKSVENERSQSIKINKSQNLDKLWQGKVAVRVYGMQSVDAVNLRPINAKKINAKVLSIGEQDLVISGNRKMRVPKSGESISETNLIISENEISFFRPPIEGKVLIDIELPESTKVDLFFNNKQIVENTTIYSPLMVRDGIIGKGEENTGKALVGVMFPQLRNQQINDKTENENGNLQVPFSKLQLKKSNVLSDGKTPIKAIIRVNEQGFVEKVNVIEPLNSQEIERQILQWQFIPYIKDGAAVKVMTLFIRE